MPSVLSTTQRLIRERNEARAIAAHHRRERLSCEEERAGAITRLAACDPVSADVLTRRVHWYRRRDNDRREAFFARNPGLRREADRWVGTVRFWDRRISQEERKEREWGRRASRLQEQILARG
jgi:hypothetical protein